MAEINSINEMYSVGYYDIETLRQIYEVGMNAMQYGSEEMSFNDAWFIVNASYAVDLYAAAGFIKDDARRGQIHPMELMILCLSMLATADLRSLKTEGVDKNLLTKKLAAAMFFFYFNTMVQNRVLCGFYVDDCHTQVNIRPCDFAESFAIDTTVIARQVVNEALIISTESGTAAVDGELVKEIMETEMDRFRCVDPASIVVELV